MVQKPIDPIDWIPAGLAAIVAVALFTIGAVGSAHVFFYQMGFCGLVVAASMATLARRDWNGRSYWNRPRRRNHSR